MNSQKLFQAIGLLSDEAIAVAEKPADSSESLNLTNTVPRRRSMLWSAAPAAAAAVVLSIVTAILFQIYRAEPPVNEGQLPVASDTSASSTISAHLGSPHVPAYSVPRVRIIDRTVSSPKVYLPLQVHGDYEGLSGVDLNDIPVITFYPVDMEAVSQGHWNLSYFEEMNSRLSRLEIEFAETPDMVSYTRTSDWQSAIVTTEEFVAPTVEGDYILRINAVWGEERSLFVIRFVIGEPREFGGQCMYIDLYHGGGDGLRLTSFDDIRMILDLAEQGDQAVAAHFGGICEYERTLNTRRWECPCFLQSRADVQNLFSWLRLNEVRFPFADSMPPNEILIRDRYGDVYVRYTLGDMIFSFTLYPANEVSTEGLTEIWANNDYSPDIARVMTKGDVNIYLVEEGHGLPSANYIICVDGVYVSLYVYIPCAAANPEDCEKCMERPDFGSGRGRCDGEVVNRQAVIEALLNFQFKTVV
jgi:hypothetical protein